MAVTDPGAGVGSLRLSRDTSGTGTALDATAFPDRRSAQIPCTHPTELQPAEPSSRVSTTFALLRQQPLAQKGKRESMRRSLHPLGPRCRCRPPSAGAAAWEPPRVTEEGMGQEPAPKKPRWHQNPTEPAGGDRACSFPQIRLIPQPLPKLRGLRPGVIPCSKPRPSQALPVRKGAGGPRSHPRPPARPGSPARFFISLL